MTQERIDNLISKILDCPDKLTDTEIAEIIHDNHLRELYDTASMLRSALQPSSSYNLDSEWQQLKARLDGKAHISETAKKRRWINAAAILVGIMLCGTIALMFFRTNDVDNTSGSIAVAVTDSIRDIKGSDTRIAMAEPVAADAITDAKAKKTDASMTQSAKTETEHMGQIDTDDTGERTAGIPLPSIDTALILTDDDMMTAQVLLATDNDTSANGSQSYLTTVNYGDYRRSQAIEPTWLSEFMKYATGLSIDNLSIQRGSANMLYRLTYTESGGSTSDRQAALSIINSLIADGICDNDPLTKVLVVGVMDNLR